MWDISLWFSDPCDKISYVPWQYSAYHGPIECATIISPLPISSLSSHHSAGKSSHPHPFAARAYYIFLPE